MGGYSASHCEIVSAHGDHEVGVWLVKAGQNFNEGAFARAVLANKGMNFALFNVECHIIQSNLARKCLRK
jgi:hypothetical protein